MALNGEDMENEGGPALSPAEQHLANVASAFTPEPEQGVATENLDDESLGIASYIQLARIYDALTLILMHFDEEAAANMVALHEQGEFVGPDPALASGDEA